MDPVSMVKNVRDVNWDSPFRYAASIAAMGTVAGIWSGEGVFGNLADAARLFRWNAAETWLRSADDWALETLPAASGFFALLLAISVLVNTTRSGTLGESRAASTAWMAVAVIAYGPPVSPLWWGSAAVAAILIRLALGRRHQRWVGVGAWAGKTFIDVIVAGAWLPLSVLLWALTPQRLRKAPGKADQ